MAKEKKERPIKVDKWSQGDAKALRLVFKDHEELILENIPKGVFDFSQDKMSNLVEHIASNIGTEILFSESRKTVGRETFVAALGSSSGGSSEGIFKILDNAHAEVLNDKYKKLRLKMVREIYDRTEEEYASKKKDLLARLDEEKSAHQFEEYKRGFKTLNNQLKQEFKNLGAPVELIDYEDSCIPEEVS